GEAEETNTAPVVVNKTFNVLPDLSGPDPIYEQELTVADFIGGYFDLEGDNPSQLWITAIGQNVILYYNNAIVLTPSLTIPYTEADNLKVRLTPFGIVEGIHSIAFKVSDDNVNPLYSSQKQLDFMLIQTTNLP